MLKTHEKYFPPVSKEDGYKYLNEMWDTLNPPVEEENIPRVKENLFFHWKNCVSILKG